MSKERRQKSENSETDFSENPYDCTSKKRKKKVTRGKKKTGPNARKPPQVTNEDRKVLEQVGERHQLDFGDDDLSGLDEKSRRIFERLLREKEGKDLVVAAMMEKINMLESQWDEKKPDNEVRDQKELGVSEPGSKNKLVFGDAQPTKKGRKRSNSLSDEELSKTTTTVLELQAYTEPAEPVHFRYVTDRQGEYDSNENQVDSCSSPGTPSNFKHNDHDGLLEQNGSDPVLKDTRFDVIETANDKLLCNNKIGRIIGNDSTNFEEIIKKIWKKRDFVEGKQSRNSHCSNDEESDTCEIAKNKKKKRKRSRDVSTREKAAHEENEIIQKPSLKRKGHHEVNVRVDGRLKKLEKEAKKTDDSDSDREYTEIVNKAEIHAKKYGADPSDLHGRELAEKRKRKSNKKNKSRNKKRSSKGKR
ncbi:hypothetical protein QAD02_012620 [Eretmocerus hayati]|uniref:Uncharacterized protein n=1 Tax=Eretmocerus hayati TaxID=131215 RepID=A0ACC2P158_9HYME|nr:hypothetical protein QAD02_012620 [Eretmocerus hayati]